MGGYSSAVIQQNPGKKFFFPGLNLSVSVWIIGLPSPGIFAHFVNSSFCFPSQFFLGKRRIRVALGDIARPPWFDYIWNLLSAGFRECFDHLKHTESLAGSQIIDTDIQSGIDRQLADNIINNLSIRRLGTPEEVAKVILFLASDQASYVNGQVIRIDGGM